MAGGGDREWMVDGSVDGTYGHWPTLYILLAQLVRALIYPGDVGANPTEELYIISGKKEAIRGMK